MKDQSISITEKFLSITKNTVIQKQSQLNKDEKMKHPTLSKKTQKNIMNNPKKNKSQNIKLYQIMSNYLMIKLFSKHNQMNIKKKKYLGKNNPMME
jgi:hypothetical protein